MFQDKIFKVLLSDSDFGDIEERWITLSASSCFVGDWAHKEKLKRNNPNTINEKIDFIQCETLMI